MSIERWRLSVCNKTEQKGQLNLMDAEKATRLNEPNKPKIFNSALCEQIGGHPTMNKHKRTMQRKKR